MKDPALVALAMSLAVVALIAVVAGCAQRPNSEIGSNTSVNYIHDDVHAVSCWTFGLGGGSNTAAISCLPDRDVRNP